jgi:hypothetical protein
MPKHKFIQQTKPTRRSVSLPAPKRQTMSLTTAYGRPVRKCIDKKEQHFAQVFNNSA